MHSRATILGSGDPRPSDPGREAPPTISIQAPTHVRQANDCEQNDLRYCSKASMVGVHSCSHFVDRDRESTSLNLGIPTIPRTQRFAATCAWARRDGLSVAPSHRRRPLRRKLAKLGVRRMGERGRGESGPCASGCSFPPSLMSCCYSSSSLLALFAFRVLGDDGLWDQIPGHLGGRK